MKKTRLWQRMTLRMQGILTQGRAWKCLRKGTIYRGYRGLSRPSLEILRLYHQHLFNLWHYLWEGEYNDLIARINQGDKVIIFTLPKVVPKIEKMLMVKPEYF